MRSFAERVAALDPDRITLEDVASVLYTWKWVAKIVMNTGIRQGSFVKEGNFYRFIG